MAFYFLGLFGVPRCSTVFTKHSTLQKILAPTLLFHTGLMAYNQCVGASELEAFELGAAAHGFIWGVSESQRDPTRRAGEPKQLTGRG